MRRVFLNVAYLAPITLAATCGVFASVLPTYSNPHSAIIAQQGRRFAISLAANPTTGYRWTSKTLGSANIVTLSDAFTKDPLRAPAMGVGGQELFTFRAASTGRATITFAYARPWEHHVPPARRAVFVVIVR